MFDSMAGWAKKGEIGGIGVSDAFFQWMLVVHVQQISRLYAKFVANMGWIKVASVAD